MTVRAKFFVAEINRKAVMKDHVEVILRPVSRGDANASWASATPSGEFKMTVNNPAAAKVFMDALGEEFYIDFTPAVPAELGDGHAFRPGTGAEGNYNGPAYCGECGSVEEAHAG